MFSKSTPILITGVNGFIGNRLHDNLTKKGYDVWSIYRSGKSREKSFKLDLTDTKKLTSNKKPRYPIIVGLCIQVAYM